MAKNSRKARHPRAQTSSAAAAGVLIDAAGLRDRSNQLGRLLDESETATLLGTAPQTLTKWRCTKRYPLPFVRIGRLIRYRETDVLRFIQSRMVHPLQVEGV